MWTTNGEILRMRARMNAVPGNVHSARGDAFGAWPTNRGRKPVRARPGKLRGGCYDGPPLALHALPFVKSIKSNILAFAVLATLVPSVGLGLLSFVGYQDVVNRNVDYELRALAKDAAGEVTLWTRERAHDLRTLSAAYTLVDGLGGGTPRAGAPHIGAPELAQYLASVQKKLEPILELTLVDTSGSVVASSADKPSAVALPSTWPTAVVATGAVVMPPHWDDARTAPTVTIAVPVLSLRNEIL